MRKEEISFFLYVPNKAPNSDINHGNYSKQELLRFAIRDWAITLRVSIELINYIYSLTWETSQNHAAVALSLMPLPPLQS